MLQSAYRLAPKPEYRATALDAVGQGFDTTLLTHLCAGVAAASTEAALAEMLDAGVDIAGQG